MKMQFDFSESAWQVAPASEYQLRCKKRITENSKSNKPMITIDYIPFNPKGNVRPDQIDRCVIRTWISLAENALFTLKNLAWACNIDIECYDCKTLYSGDLERCPSCGSFKFSIDPDFIDTATPWALVTVEKSQDGLRDVNTIVKYLR